MKASNYDLMRDQMETEFLNYDQEKMIRKYGLAHDDKYLYLTFVGRKCRIGRNSGRVEWTEDDFCHAVHADYNISMTIFDVLCYAKDDCCLSGRFMPVNQLKGTVQSASPGKDMFGGTAKKFDGHTGRLARACELLGGQKERVGDVSYRIPLFRWYPAKCADARRNLRDSVSCQTDSLPVILQFWESDEEFPPVLKLMWDENILSYMHFETTFFAAGHLLERLNGLMGEALLAEHYKCL